VKEYGKYGKRKDITHSKEITFCISLLLPAQPTTSWSKREKNRDPEGNGWLR